MSFFDIFSKKDEKDEQFKEAYILALVHRLRTPLNGARWALDSFIGGGDSDANRKTLNDGYNKIIDTINMVNDILKVAEINSKEGLFNLNKERINLCNVVDNIIENLGFLIKKKEITLEYDNECEPLTIYGDLKVLDIGLANLFDNAFRYSPKGKVNIKISKEGKVAKLIIKDNGIGIDGDDLKHLFEKFFRGKNAKIIDPNESGVGLYATKKIVEMHDGKIYINSEINKGTIVKVEIPIVD